MTLRDLINKLEKYEKVYGGDIPVRTFDLDRHMSDASVELCESHNSNEVYVYIGED